MDILKTIVEQKKQEVAAARLHIPESEIRRKAHGLSAPRSFFHALEKPAQTGINIIAEIKRASPSKGWIRKELDSRAYAVSYERGGAAAISVLTDGPNFNGSAEDLREARKATSLPVLRKDFLICSYQIYQSKVMEADAVLLIALILSQGQLKEYLHLAGELGLDALVEVHTEADLEKATKAGAKLIGINNRNLRSFKTDIRTAVRLKTLLEPHQIAVAESGIKTRGDILALQKAGIWNFLIGESLVRAEDPQTFLKQLLGR
ncbi:MAG: indole-3-glycerol phosphate synthase TrpC [Deltaproteobacteria bacterium]|nr:indole-3-glycerol phosphate synthase TrpC [Deltaproteobacteria bacterium]MBW1959999.1 indole-3-glycerol phosphate synthase TrpC [Deltaproteobacteria bacterium]MBW1996111.1 indole-3-glycerol phosphate synthase TrpC [Deltaproteobacteria bacterium]MBW2153606.1 indole-3-glycerol phosphate synthase TrpC [Deltaproteobacteria bacterium]